MAVTEESRHELYTYFDETMGRERATTLMESLPPVGWGDVATKQFVTTEQQLSRAEFKAELAKLEAKILDKMMAQMFAYIGVNLGLLGLAMGAVKLFF